MLLKTARSRLTLQTYTHGGSRSPCPTEPHHFPGHARFTDGNDQGKGFCRRNLRRYSPSWKLCRRFFANAQFCLSHSFYARSLARFGLARPFWLSIVEKTPPSSPGKTHKPEAKQRALDSDQFKTSPTIRRLLRALKQSCSEHTRLMNTITGPQYYRARTLYLQ